ncbi:MAG: putative HNHc nuclease [Alphaproteobacteria bacterium]
MVSLPKRLERSERRRDARSCPAHRAWVRRHRCCVPGCLNTAIECAHVRTGTDGGLALKPSDRWAISLCCDHHQEQHRLGERAFEKRYGITLYELAKEFARRSPHLRNVWAGPD